MRTWIRAGLVLVCAVVNGCVSLPRDRSVPAPAAAPLFSTAVRCSCVVNERRDDNARCHDPSVCPGPDCPCPGMDFELCLPPDLNHETATDPAVIARLADPAFDFDGAVQEFCRVRAQAIMTSIGSVSQHAIICDGKDNSYFNVDVPVLFHCQAVSYGEPGSPSTWYSEACKSPCGNVECVNGPPDERPNANCDGDDIFTRTALHPEACRCNRVTSASTCDGQDSEPFCAPPPGEPRGIPGDLGAPRG